MMHVIINFQKKYKTCLGTWVEKAYYVTISEAGDKEGAKSRLPLSIGQTHFSSPGD